MNKRSIPGWNFTEYILLKFLTALINAPSIETATAIARFFGRLLFYIWGSRRKTALQNLTFAYRNTISQKEKEAIVRESFANLAVSLMEFFRIPSMLKNAQNHFEFEGTEHLDEAFRAGHGIIFTISHLGSWEYLAFLPYLRGYPCSVVVRETKNPYVYPWIQALRRQTQLNPITKTGAAKEILRELKKNHLVAILIDQWAGPEGLWINFFGEPTSTTSVPYRLAVKTKAALVPGYCIRVRPGHYKIIIKKQVSPSDPSQQDAETSTTLELNRRLEEEIRKFPDQWTWGHHRWKARNRYRNQKEDHRPSPENSAHAQKA